MTPADEGVDDAEVDRLYQLPLDRFIEARNDLVRRCGRGDAPAVRALAKPNVLAWALNQLYWSRRATFDRLVAAAARLRATQADALLGKRADLRAAGEDHRVALREALTEASAILQGAGHSVSPDAIRELTGALEALPWKDRPGRLTRPPAASGFEALAGLRMAPGPRAEKARMEAGEPRAKQAPVPAADSDQERHRKQEQRQERQAARAALTAARRHEAETASLLSRAERQLATAREREQAARDAVQDAERARSAAEDELRELNQALRSAREAVAAATRRVVAAEQTAESG